MSVKAKKDAVVRGVSALWDLVKKPGPDEALDLYHGAGYAWWDDADNADKAFKLTNDGGMPGVSLTPSEETARAFANMRSSGQGGAVGQFQVKGNIHPSWTDAIDEAAAQGIPVEQYLAGYDGVYIPDYDEVRVFDPSRIAKKDSPNLLAGLAGATAVGASVAPEDAEASFAGVLAKYADEFMLTVAQKMKHEGLPRDEIWQKTGWMEGPDQRWRFEIDDSQAKFEAPDYHKFYGQALDRMGYKPGQAGTPDWVTTSAAAEANHKLNRVLLHDGLQHDELFTAYPSNKFGQGLPNTRMEVGGADTDYLGAFNPKTDTISISQGRIDAPVDQRSVALHETQHAIQEKEGFAKGGSPEIFQRKAQLAMQDIRGINEKLSQLVKQKDLALKRGDTAAASLIDEEYVSFLNARDRLVPTAQLDPYEEYRKLAGEVESRNVQSRIDMTPQERRSTPPWATADTPEGEQIIRLDSRSQSFLAPEMYRQMEETRRVVSDFAQRRAPKASFWKQKRDELLDLAGRGVTATSSYIDTSPDLKRWLGDMGEVGSATLDSMEYPVKGVSALAALIASGDLDTAANVARMPQGEIADEAGGLVTDYLAQAGYPGIAPAAGTAVNVGINMAGF